MFNTIFKNPASDIFSIKPVRSYSNELGIRPTGDYDIHLFEANTQGAITLGDYGQTNFRVYGPGGANNGGGHTNAAGCSAKGSLDAVQKAFGIAMSEAVAGKAGVTS